MVVNLFENLFYFGLAKFKLYRQNITNLLFCKVIGIFRREKTIYYHKKSSENQKTDCGIKLAFLGFFNISLKGGFPYIRYLLFIIVGFIFEVRKLVLEYLLEFYIKNN